jgi:alanine-glyoxylate transaminase/serine-glyoxylate transaminase/serine-pyruvate transaminase
MEAYEERRPAYFGTPAVNLIAALNVSLGQILDEGMDARFERHRKLGQACKAAMAALGMGQVPVEPEYAANTMTAPYYPEGVAAADLLPKIKAAGAIVAGGLHPDIKARYFRIGHMGPTNLGDLLATVSAIEIGLLGSGYDLEPGAGVAAAQAAYRRT